MISEDLFDRARAAEAPFVERTGRQVRVSEGPARCPLVWTFTFPTDEWAGHIERRLEREWRLAQEWGNGQAFETEQLYAKAVRGLTELIRTWVPRGVVKYSVEGVEEAFGYADA